MNVKPIISGVMTVLLLVCAQASHANLIFNVSLDTTSLLGHSAAPFYLEFQLNDGSGSGNGNNRATLSSFVFGGGLPAGAPTLAGGASGALSGTVNLIDSAFFNEFFQEFMPGALLSFSVNLSTVVESGPQPDQFSFAILDCSLVEIPTLNPADALLQVDIDSASPAIQRFAGDPNRSTVCSGDPVLIPAVLVQQVPEPLSGGLLTLGLALLWVRRRGARSACRPYL